MKWIGRLFVLIGVCVFVAMMVSILAMVSYPGAFRLTAPVLCPDAQPDAFVVRYSGPTGDGGTYTNFTLFCMDDRGEFTEVGSWLPLVVTFGSITGGLVALAFALIVLGRLRATTRDVDATGLPWSVTGIPEATRLRVQALIGEDKMIHAVKAIRDDTGMGLKGAKGVAEALRDGQHVPTARQPSEQSYPEYPEGYPTG